MKLLELDLLAFGPFTGVTLDLSEGEDGLHVVYGPNEAGKTSALRALHALLFGIPPRTTDAFLHENKDLRLGGRLRRSDGEELSFVRRKGNQKTVLGLDGQPIGDDALAPFLGGVESGLFKTMFGINHERLVEGAEAILQDSGEVGQSLFSAGLGGAGIRGIINEIDSEADELYRRRGQKPAVNRAVAEYKEAKRELQNDALSGRQWFDHDKALRRAEAQQRDLLRELAKLTAARDRKQRLLLALPNLNRRLHELQRIGDLGETKLLSEDFPQRRREIGAALETAREALDRSAADVQRLRAKVKTISVPDLVLRRAEEITDLHQRLGSHHKATRDRTKLSGQLKQLQGDAEDLARQLRPEAKTSDVASWRLTTAAKARVRELASGHAGVMSSKKHAFRRLAELETRRSAVLNDLELAEPVRDVEILERVVAAAGKNGDLEGSLSSLLVKWDVEETQIQADFQRLGVTKLSLTQLEKTPLPSDETINRYDALLGDAGDDVRRLEEQIDTVRRGAHDLRRQVREQQEVGDVPSERDLAQARELRDEGWRLIRRTWIDGENVDDEVGGIESELDLAGIYEERVSGADEISDRLRREADRVAKNAELAAGLEEAEHEGERLNSRRNEINEHLEKLRSEWSELWSDTGVVVASPREMRAWSANKDRLLERLGHHHETQAEIHRLRSRVEFHRGALHEALVEIGEEGAAKGETLEFLLARCSDVLETLEKRRRLRVGLEQRLTENDREIAVAQTEHEAAESAVADWQAKWEEAIRALDVSGDALPGEVIAVLEDLEELGSKTNEIDDIRARIKGIDREADAFESDLKDLVAEVAPELAEKAPEDAAQKLHSMLSEARSDAVILANLEEQIDSAVQNCADAEKTINIMTRRRSELCDEAGCDHPDELPDAEQRSADLRAARKTLQDLEEQLVEHSGMTLDRLAHEAQDVDPGVLHVEIDDLENRLAELEKQRSDIDQSIGSERQALAAMDGSDRAAVAAEEAQAKLAEIRTHVHRYMRLRLASAVLQREIERFRSEHQAPLLRRASELFSVLTVGAFESLGTAFDNKDQPVLEGVRAEGGRVGVAGMSSGTRDQLYLALRLASLEKYLDAAEPMPFIVDDILMSFDDERAAAALEVLGDLSRKTQVLFFTHHQRLVELASRAAGDLVVHHSLGTVRETGDASTE